MLTQPSHRGDIVLREGRCRQVQQGAQRVQDWIKGDSQQQDKHSGQRHQLVGALAQSPLDSGRQMHIPELQQGNSNEETEWQDHAMTRQIRRVGQMRLAEAMHDLARQTAKTR